MIQLQLERPQRGVLLVRRMHQPVNRTRVLLGLAVSARAERRNLLGAQGRARLRIILDAHHDAAMAGSPPPGKSATLPLLCATTVVAISFLDVFCGVLNCVLSGALTPPETGLGVDQQRQ